MVYLTKYLYANIISISEIAEEIEVVALIEVKVKEVVMNQGQEPFLLLVDLEEEIALPIAIGFWEAQVIILKVQGELSPRPMTHDLLKNLCARLGAAVNKIVINDVQDDTFFAQLYLQKGDEEIVIDARPSDAVALAMTVGVPLYITDKVAGHTIFLQEILEQRDDDDYQDPGAGRLVH